MPRELPFNPEEYECIVAPVVDTFTVVRNEDGANITVSLDEPYLKKMASNMNKKFQDTGDLSPLIIGHTKKDAPESDWQSVGYLHEYYVAPWEKNGPTMLAKHYIRKQNTVVVDGVPLKLSAKEVCERWPRRSAEIWLSRAELDPHCLLGRSTPERSLGILKLSKDGETSIVTQAPGDLKVPDPATPLTPENMGDLPILKQLESAVSQITQLVAQLTPILDKLQGAGDQLAGPDGGQGGGQDPQMDEAALDQLIASLGAGGQGGGEPQGAPAPQAPAGPSPDQVKLQKENDELKLQLARASIVAALKPLGKDQDEVLVSDLLILPEDVRNRTIARLPAPAVVAPVTLPNNTDLALQLSRPAGTRRVVSADDRKTVVAHAAKNGLNFQSAAVALGFTV